MGAKRPGLKIEAKRLGGKRLGGKRLGAKRLVTVCYMVDIYPFKLCQFILKMRILQK